MHKFLLLCLFFIIGNSNLKAQPATAHLNNSGNSHEYYIRISGINNRRDVEELQNSISKKPGINFFMANRYPVRYFLMKCNRQIDKTEFKQWLGNRSAGIEFYGEGKKSMEQAILLYNKSKAR